MGALDESTEIALEDTRKIPISIRDYLSIKIRMCNKTGVANQLTRRILEKLIVMKDKNPSILDVLDYEESTDPYIYTSHDYYLDLFISLMIGRKLNISFTQFMKEDIIDANAMIIKCSREMSNVDTNSI